jgi:uncharacterized low-complexity protein
VALISLITGIRRIDAFGYTGSKKYLAARSLHQRVTNRQFSANYLAHRPQSHPAAQAVTQPFNRRTIMNRKTKLAFAFAATVALSPLASAAGNPFALTALSSGYQLAQADVKQKDGKCGEAKCGANKAKAQEAKCGADKKVADGSCGANKKAQEGSCGANKKAADGSCGANKK